jgi:hypothetical protein
MSQNFSQLLRKNKAKLFVYSMLTLYVFRIHKFPYFMYYENFKKERLIKQYYMMLFGVFFINVCFGLKAILDEDVNKIEK